MMSRVLDPAFVLSIQCGGSGIFIPDPNFSIQNRVKKILDLGSGSKRFWIPDPDPHQRISVFLTQKFVSKLSEI
jgi:hypothetical protein